MIGSVAIGRAREEAMVATVVAAAIDGHGGALVVRGEPGIGKSTLLEHARACGGEAAIVEASGVEVEGEVAFAGLTDVLRPVLGALDALTPVQAEAIETILGAARARPPDRLTIGGATLALLAAAADARPLLVLVDDAQWLDAESQAALAFAARRVGSDAVAILFAARDGERATFIGEGIPELRLTGLARPDALELLDGRVPSPQVADTLVDRTGGNPLALLELPAAVTPEQLAGTAPLDDPLPVAPAVEEAFARRAFRLGEDVRLALVVTAADDLGDDALVAGALAQLGLGAAHLDSAEDDGLLRRTPGRVAFRHPLVRSAVYHAAAPSERRRAHAALAAAYTDVDDDRGAWHLAAAAVGPDPVAAAALAATAARARDRGGYQAASAGFERAARLTGPGADRAGLLAAAADTALLAGRPAVGQALVDQGLADTGIDPHARAELLGTAGRIAFHAGDQERAVDVFLEGATLAEETAPALASALLADAVAAATQLGGDALTTAAARLEAQRAPADPWLALLVAQARGAAASVGGGGGSREWLGRAVAFVDEGLAEPRTAEHLYWAGRINFMLGRNGAAATFARRALDAARDGRASMLGAEALRLSAVADFDRGRWRAAYAEAAQAVELATELGLPSTACACLGVLAEIDAGTGNATACEEHVTRAVELAAEYHLGFYRERAERALGQLALATGRLDKAVEQFERVWARLRSTGNLEPNVTPVFDLIEAYVRLGRVADARDAFAWARDAYPPESPFEQAMFDRCAALFDDDFEPIFERALAAHRLDGVAGEFPFDVARTRLAFGERLRRDGKRREARAQLREALSMFEEIGASAWADRAATELDASGERRRSAAVSREHLTPRELQIAVAVAEGGSNREVAAELFLTPKTVEFHLTRVYRKLGVRSRTELVRLLSQEPAE